MGLDIGLLTSVAKASISHNYTNVAKVLGVYYPIWRGDMYGIRYASDLIPFLDMAENLLGDNGVAGDLDYFFKDKELDSLEEFVLFIRNLKRYCEEYPDALLHFSR